MLNRSLTGAVACATVLQLAVSAAAQTARTPVLPELDGTLELSLREAIRLSIENNLDVQISRYGPLLASEDVMIAWGVYDPELFGEGGVNDTQTPSAFGLEERAAESQRVNREEYFGALGLRGLLPALGASYEITYSGSEVKTDSGLSVLSPEYTQDVLFTATFPLMRGLIWNEPWTRVRVSEIGVDSSVDEFRTELMDIVDRTERAYWDLVSNRDAVRVAQKSLETARALLDQTEAQYEVGVVSRVEVVEAAAGVADREFRLISATAREGNSQDVLIDEVLGPFLAPRATLRFELTDSPETVTISGVDVEAATHKAFDQRPELAVAAHVIEQRQVQLKLASHNRLPELNIVGSYGFTGLSGQENPDRSDFRPDPPPGGPPNPPLPPPRTKNRFWNANDDFFRGKGNRNYTVQGVLSFPLGNVEARHEHSRANLELRRARSRLRRLQQSIVTEVRRAARDLEAALEGVEAANRREAAAAEQLRAERVRLEHGESTPFDVLLREEDLVEAENQKILAQNVYQTSITGLERAQGTILSRHNVVIEDAARLR
ncbi:MAG: TolC family protein [Myxococcota bacterium]|nr:TolC family protein [Myxococcota bacterium]